MQAKTIDKHSPETITFTQLTELYADNTSQCWTDQTTLQWTFSHSAREQIDIVDGSIDFLEAIDDFIGHFATEIVPRGSTFQIAECAVVVITGYAVITS